MEVFSKTENQISVSIFKLCVENTLLNSGLGTPRLQTGVFTFGFSVFILAYPIILTSLAMKPHKRKPIS